VSRYVVEIAPAAEADIRDGFAWYRERNALIADAFRTKVFDVVDRIGEAPLAKPADEDGNRKRVLHRFPYSVIYEVQGNTVTVVAVAHHRRKPGYWVSKQS
jgi:plasmid stabilization system protein ParE